MTEVELMARLVAVIVRPDAAPRDVHRVVNEAMRHNAAAVVVTPVYGARVATMLRGSGIGVASVIGFPAGTSKATIKAIEATSSIKDGAGHVAVVAFAPNLLAGDVDAVRAELLEVVRGAKATRRDSFISAIVQVQAGQVETACRAVRESACDAIVLVNPSAELVRLAVRHGEGIEVHAWSTRAEAEGLIVEGAMRVWVEDGW